MGKIITELLKERQKSLYKFRLKIRLAFLFWVMLTNHNAGTNCVLQGQSQCLRLRKKSETVTGNGKCWPQCFTALPRSPEPCQYGSQPKCEMVEDVTTDLEIKMSPWATAGPSMVQKLTDLIFSQLLGRHNGLVYRASPRGPFYNGKVTQWGVTDEAGSEMGWPWCQWGCGCPTARSSASGLASVSGCHQEHIPGFTASATLCATWPVWSLGVLGWAVSEEWASPGCELGGRGAVRAVVWASPLAVGMDMVEPWTILGPRLGTKRANCYPMDRDAVLQCCWGAGAHSGRSGAGSRQGGCRVLIN